MPVIASTYSTVAPEALLQHVVPHYRIDNPLSCQFWERGANDTYKISCADASYFLRVYRHRAFTREANEFEAAFLSHLHQHQFPVAYPIEKKAGGFITEIQAPEGPRQVLVTAMVGGKPADYSALSDCRLVGSSVAKLHLTANSFDTTLHRCHLDDRWLFDQSNAVIEEFLRKNTDDLSFFEDVTDKTRRLLNDAPLEKLDFGVCHGDLHGGNLHIDNGVVTHFDFEECAFGYRVYDLATFKWGVCRGKSSTDCWEAFIDGYNEVRPVTDLELSLIDTFVICRELAETAYGIRHVRDFGHNDIMAADVDDMRNKLRKLADRCTI